MSPAKRKDETAQESIKPDFLDGIDISREEAEEMENNAFNGAARDIADKEALSNTEIANAETAGGPGVSTEGDKAESDKVDGLYNSKDKGKNRGRFSSLLSSRRNKLIAGGVGGGGVIGLGLLGLLFLPLGPKHMVTNLQQTFFANSEEAAEKATNRLLSSYIIYKVMPGLSGTCPSTKANKSCAKVSQDDNIVTQLYRSWRDQNLEGKMYEKHGIEIRREGNTMVMRSDRLQEDIFRGDYNGGNDAEFERKFFTTMDRKEVRKQMLNSIENETFYKRMMYRYKYGRLMERKYGVVRCLIACDYRQDKADRKELRKMKMKAWVIHRVVGPLNEGYGMAFECAVAQFDCAAEHNNTVDEDGTKKTKFENDLRDKTKEIIGDGRMTQERLAKLQTDAGEIRENGMANFLLKKILGEAGGKLVGNVVPGLGLADALAKLVEGVTKAGPAIKTMQYAMASGAAVNVWTMYQANASEVNSGNINVEELGYVADSLGDNFGKDQGGGGAGSTPYYQDIMGSQGVSTASLFPKAEAASPFKCDDGSYITTGLCPEMSVSAATGGAEAVKSFSDFLRKYHLDSIAAIWNSSIGKIFDALNNLIGIFTDLAGDLAGALTPDAIKDKLADLAKAIGEWFTEKLFVSFITDDTSGGRMFEAAALGANIAGNDFAHYGLGAGKISDQAANRVRYARAVEQKQEFMEKSMFARIFDTSSSYSTASQLALAMPSGASSTAHSLSSTLLNPVSMISSTLTGSRKVNAAPKENLDLAGVTQYGYAENDPIFSVTDYEKWWTDSNCDDESVVTAWGESATMSSKNGSFENDQPNRCKLIEAMSTSNCGYTNDECLTPEELGDQVNSYGENTNGGVALRAASFNILHSPDGNVEARLRKSIDTLLNPPGGGEQVDVVGLQEVRKDQLAMLKASNFGQQYNMFPNTPNNREYEPNIVAWRKDKYTVIKEATMNARYFFGNPEQMPVVKLKENSTDRVLYFASIHNPRSGGDPFRGNNEGVRDDNARLFQEYFANLKQQEPDTPMILVGDFNAGYQAADKLEDVPYGRRSFCILTNGIFWDAWHASKKIDGKCPKRSTVNFIDHIFIDRDTQVSKFFTAPRGIDKNGSDHPTIFADLTGPDLTGSDGWSWPLKSSVTSGPCYGVEVKDLGKHAGMDMNTSKGDNPVLAIHSGKVVRVGADPYAGNYITILADAPFNNKRVYYSYEHLKSGTIKFAEGDRVLGGEKVAIAGTSGRFFGSSLGHLHIVTATTNSLGGYGSLGTTFNPMDVLKNAGPAPEGYKCTQ